MSAERPHLAIVVEGATASRYFADAVTRLVDVGVRVSVVSFRDTGPLADAIAPAGVVVHPIGATGLPTYPLAVIRLRRLLTRLAPSVVAAHEAIAASVTATALIRTGTPMAYHRHHDRSEQRVLDTFSRWAAQHATSIVAVSRSVAAASVRDDRIPPDRALVASNGVSALPVDMADVDRYRDDLGIAPNDAVVVIVARARRGKGHLELFDAAARASRFVGRPLHVVVVGDGEFLPAIRAVVGRASPATVHIVGARDDVGSWMTLADVVAIPSLNEPFGLTSVEAMSVGRPVVASRTGGLADVVDEPATGLLVPPGDAGALSDALVRLLNDPALAVTMGQAGYRRWQGHFTIEHMVERWLAAYRSIGLR